MNVIATSMTHAFAEPNKKLADLGDAQDGILELDGLDVTQSMGWNVLSIPALAARAVRELANVGVQLAARHVADQRPGPDVEA